MHVFNLCMYILLQVVHSGKKRTKSEGSGVLLSGQRKRKHSSTSSLASSETSQHLKKSSNKKRFRKTTSASKNTRSGVAAALRSNSQAALVEGLPYYSSHTGYVPKLRSRSRSKSIEKPQAQVVDSAISVDTSSLRTRGHSEKHIASARSQSHTIASSTKSDNSPEGPPAKKARRSKKDKSRKSTSLVDSVKNKTEKGQVKSKKGKKRKGDKIDSRRRSKRNRTTGSCASTR